MELGSGMILLTHQTHGVQSMLSHYRSMPFTQKVNLKVSYPYPHKVLYN